MEKNYLQTHGTAMGTKMAVAFSNIFMNKVETEILSQSLFKPLVWKRYIDDIFPLWTTNRDRIEHFIEQANNHHPTIKFTAEISDKETTFLDAYIYKGERFERDDVMCALISNQLRHFSIPIMLPVTHKELKKASLKGKPSDSSEQTLPK